MKHYWKLWKSLPNWKRGYILGGTCGAFGAFSLTCLFFGTNLSVGALKALASAGGATSGIAIVMFYMNGEEE